MKKIFTLVVLAFFFQLNYAKQVPVDTAKLVAKNFLKSKTNSFPAIDISNLDLVYTVSSKANSNQGAIQPDNYFYVFNVSSPTGFIIVSADDNVLPVLGYSSESDFDTSNIPINCAKWLEGYKDEIRFVIEHQIPETQEIISDWKNLKSSNPINSGSRSGSVAPLIQTHWDQSPYYNDMCPYNYLVFQHTVTGCVATAMAQIMKYWSYPSHGYSSHNYNCPFYGSQAANFGATTYQWSQMPNSVTATNNAVATLMYHCGVSIDMDYGIASTGGSSINSLQPVADALKTYFGYSSTTQFATKYGNYSDAQWIQLLKSELDASRPVQYAGTGNGGGHSFVCDGYNQIDEFHFNWGWSGQADGYFTIGSLNPGSLGTGGGQGGYNSNQQIVKGIQPPTNPTNYDLRLYSAITVPANPFQSGGAYSVNADIRNYGGSDFTGSFSAAIFNDQGVFVQFIQTLSGQTLQAGYHNTFTFSTNPLTLIPGTYQLVVYYNTGGNNYVIVDQASFYNPGSITITGPPNDIQMYSNTTVSPSPVVLGQSSTITADIANYGATNITGWVSAELYDMQGNWIVTVDELQGTINSNTYTTATFSTAGLNVSPGTYYVAFKNSPDYVNWYLIYNGSYPNPIPVTVVSPPLSPDIYEVNNTLPQAYSLPITFSVNTATKNTIGSNCHVGNDYDYYKVNLASGYNYSFTARLYDAYNSGNGQTYSLDALVSYSLDGVNWSDAFDDIISPNFNANGGSTVYFFVSPYFVGETGTYLLDMTITRTPCTLSPSVTPTGPVTICQGQNQTLTAPNGSGYSYQWKRNGTNITTNGTSQTYSVTQSGSYTVVVTANGCSGTSNAVVVTVNPTVTPTVSITPNPSGTVCPGTSITFTATPNGQGSSPSYQWKLNSGNVGSNSLTYTNPSLVNGDIVKVILTSNATCLSQQTATSNPFMAAVWGPTNANAGNDVSITQGNSTTLTATGGVSYHWSTGSSSQSITVSPNSTTTYTVTVTDGNGCSATDAVVVNVQGNCASYILTSLNINIPASVGTYRDTLSTGTGCGWTINEGCSWLDFINTSGNGAATLTFNAQQNILTSQRTCFANIQGNILTITQAGDVGCVPPVANFTPSQTSGFTPVTVNFTDNSTYSPTQWYWTFAGGNPSSSTIQNPVNIVYANPGLFDVTLKVINACDSNTMVMTSYINILGTGVNEIQPVKSIVVLPNPNNGTFILKAELTSKQDVKVNVFNSLGQIIYTKNLLGNSTSIQTTFDLSSHAKGVYYLQLFAGERYYYEKVLVE